MNVEDQLNGLKSECQEAAKWFSSMTALGKTSEQDAFNAAILKALKHAHDAITSLAKP